MSVKSAIEIIEFKFGILFNIKIIKNETLISKIYTYITNREKKSILIILLPKLETIFTKIHISEIYVASRANNKSFLSHELLLIFRTAFLVVHKSKNKTSSRRLGIV